MIYTFAKGLYLLDWSPFNSIASIYSIHSGAVLEFESIRGIKYKGICEPASNYRARHAADESSNEPQSADDCFIDGFKGEGVFNMILAAVIVFCC